MTIYHAEDGDLDAAILEALMKGMVNIRHEITNSASFIYLHLFICSFLLITFQLDRNVLNSHTMLHTMYIDVNVGF